MSNRNSRCIMVVLGFLVATIGFSAPARAVFANTACWATVTSPDDGASWPEPKQVTGSGTHRWRVQVDYRDGIEADVTAWATWTLSGNFSGGGSANNTWLKGQPLTVWDITKYTSDTDTFMKGNYSASAIVTVDTNAATKYGWFLSSDTNCFTITAVCD